jgi:hypothetical protein
MEGLPASNNAILVTTGTVSGGSTSTSVTANFIQSIGISENTRVPAIGFNRNTFTGSIYDPTASGWQFTCNQVSSNSFQMEHYSSTGALLGIPLFVSSNGYVGINQLASNYPLDVNGTVSLPLVHYSTNGVMMTAPNIGVQRNFLIATDAGDGVFISHPYQNTLCMGYDACISKTANEDDTAFGDYALRSDTIGKDNTAFGDHALANLTAGQANTTMGSSAMPSMQGNFNSCFGVSCMQDATNGNGNACLGTSCLNSMNSALATDNYAVGSSAGFNTTSGTGNLFIGTSAGYYNTTGNYNSFIGFNTYSTTPTINTSIAIGYLNRPSASSQILIGSGITGSGGSQQAFIGDHNNVNSMNLHVDSTTVYTAIYPSLPDGPMQILGTTVTVSNISLSSSVVGTLSDSNLSSNVDLLNSTQTITASKTFTSSVTVNAGVGTALQIGDGGDFVITHQVSGADSTLYNDVGILNVTTPLNTPTLTASSGTVSGQFTAGMLVVTPASLATMQGWTTTPGWIIPCSDCTTDAICISTGTIHSFVRPSDRTATCL